MDFSCALKVKAIYRRISLDYMQTKLFLDFSFSKGVPECYINQL